jgi:glycosyltransferase involved in cell wall biosynthesis
MDGVNPSSCTVLFGGWAQALRDVGCQFTVLSLREDRQAGKYLRERGIEELYSEDSKYSLQHIKTIRGLIIERKIDVVHLHGYGAAHFGRVASRQVGIPNVVHEHAVLQPKFQHVALDWLLRKKTDAAIAVSKNVAAFMREWRCIPAEKMHVIGNGIDLSRFKAPSPKERSRARKELGIPDDALIVGTVTRFREEKGNEFLIRSFAAVRAQYPNAHLVLVGDGPLADRLHRIAAEEKVGDGIHWLGFRADVESVISTFDVHVIPSLTEGFPLALAEGMAVGNAMVVTAVGGMLELAVEGENALLVPPSDAPAIAAATLRLFGDRLLVTKLRQHAIRSSESMSISRSAQGVFRLYGELVENSGGEHS